MELTSRTSQTLPPEVAAALDRLWARFLPEIQTRVGILETASAAFAAGRLSSEQREAAKNSAHKLAGVLGSYGLAEGTRMARELEEFYSGATVGSGRLGEITAVLRGIVENRS